MGHSMSKGRLISRKYGRLEVARTTKVATALEQLEAVRLVLLDRLIAYICYSGYTVSRLGYDIE